MPLVRYVIFSGGILLALLFLADWYLPKPPLQAAGADPAHPVIRIHSENKWPAAVNIDTTMPIVAALPATGDGDGPIQEANPPRPAAARPEDVVVAHPRPKAAEHSRRRVRPPSNVAVRETRRCIATYQFSDGWEWPQARW